MIYLFHWLAFNIFRLILKYLLNSIKNFNSLILIIIKKIVNKVL